MKEQILQEMGLSRNESKVYLALLETGSSSVNNIFKISKLHRPNVYESLDRLARKGLVTYISKDGVKYYEASDPDKFRELLKQKEDLLAEILPQLRLAKQMSVKDTAHVMEGLEGIKATLDDMAMDIKNGSVKKIYAFGIPRMIFEKLGVNLTRFHNIRIAHKVQQIHIYNENAQDRIKYLNSLPYTQAGYLPKEYNSPATTSVYGNKIAFWIWSDSPFVLIVESERMAEVYTKYFDLLWGLSKK